VDVELPKKLQFLFKPARYKVSYGGRGSAKSWSVARALLVMATQKPIRILCTREIQRTIKDSVHKLLSDQIREMGFSGYFDIQRDTIRCITTGAEFIFGGLRADVEQIKSLEGVDVAWVEEAQKVSENSWKVLAPTIRKEDSEIWVTFNPDLETDPTAKRFIFHPPPGAIIQEVNWQDNPWFPETLRKEMEYDYRVDPDAAANTWGGKFRKASNAQIFRGKYTVESFEPNLEFWNGPYFGADWGFSQDPTVLLKLWIFQQKLYIEYEAYGVGVELNEIPELFLSVPGWWKEVKDERGRPAGWEALRNVVIRGDSSRPETISHCNNLGVPCVAAEKWSGSVEDGIAYLRHFEQIVIHPRCKHTEEEARLYSYKVDRITGDILPIIVDAHNHCWDAARYALEPAIRQESELVVIHDEQVSINPDLDDFDARF